MMLYVLRHGVAEEVGPEGTDGSRRLTPGGRRKLRAAAVGMRALGLTFDAILTSPLVRAAETAAIVAEAQGSQAGPRELAALEPPPGLERAPALLLHAPRQRLDQRPDGRQRACGNPAGRGELPQPVDGRDRVLALAEAVLQAPEAPEQLARRAVAQAAQRLERVAQPLRPHAQAMELGRLRLRAEAAARTHHGAHVRAEQVGGDVAQPRAAADRRTARGLAQNSARERLSVYCASAS